jgi:hypothetical protein
MIGSWIPIDASGHNSPVLVRMHDGYWTQIQDVQVGEMLRVPIISSPQVLTFLFPFLPPVQPLLCIVLQYPAS